MTENEQLAGHSNADAGHSHHGHTHTVEVKKVDKLSATRIRLSIEIPFDEVAKHEEQTARRYVQAARLPGFRPGKAPPKMVKEKYKDDIHKEVLSHLVEAGLYEALQKSKHIPVNRPRIDFKGFAFDKKQPLAFEAEFEIQPEIELRDFTGIKLKAAATDVSDEEVEKALQDLRQRLAVLEPSELTTPEKNLFGVVDIAFAVGDAPLDTTQTKPYTVELGTGQVLADLDTALMGMKVGEEKNVITKFPDDYHDKELAGKETTYFCRLVELKKKVLPELDESFANQLRPGATLEQIRGEIRQNIEGSKKGEADRATRKEILDHLIKNNSFSIATTLVEQQMGRMAKWMEEDYKRRGLPPIEWKEADVQSLRTKAEEMVRGSLLLKEVALKQNISLDEEKFETKVGEIAKEMNRSVEETRKWLEGRGMLDQLKDEVITDQVYQFLIENAEVSQSK